MKFASLMADYIFVQNGVIVGVYESSSDCSPTLTPAAEQINSTTSGNLAKLLQ